MRPRSVAPNFDGLRKTPHSFEAFCICTYLEQDGHVECILGIGWNAWYNLVLRNPDPEKERSERKLTLNEFLLIYNDGLPEQFVPATVPLLRKFEEANPNLFGEAGVWTLERHRRQFMDWMRQYMRSLRLMEQK